LNGTLELHEYVLQPVPVIGIIRTLALLLLLLLMFITDNARENKPRQRNYRENNSECRNMKDLIFPSISANFILE
jgi:hypothetical protein